MLFFGAIWGDFVEKVLNITHLIKINSVKYCTIQINVLSLHQKNKTNNNLNRRQRISGKRTMTTITCNNSERKSVKFFNNGATIMVFAIEDNEYWFTIGDGYATENGAKRAAVRVMGKYGYTFDSKKMKNLKIR